VQHEMVLDGRAQFVRHSVVPSVVLEGYP
jgi:hypothetical protein